MSTIQRIQAEIRDRHLDGWLFCDHHHRDPIAYRILGLSESSLVSRRWFYLIPADGKPLKLVHSIEAFHLDPLPGTTNTYAAWQEMMDGLRKICSGRQNLAMQFSPNNMLFTVSMVDAGTVDLIRSFGVNVISSAELVAEFESAWSEEQIETHFAARDSIDSIVDETFREIGHRVRNGGTTEFAIQQCIVEAFRRERLISDGPPIVAINENCSNPHYVPSREHFAQIDVGDLVLLDVWGKKDVKNSVYYDISWVAFAGDVVPDRVVKVFDIVRCARDAAIDKVRSSVQEEKRIAGWEVDRAAREIIERAGYGGYLRNRVGHSIGIDVHGNGANIDDYESHEERSLLPNTCFSIEPGIYLPDFGLRSEVNMLVREMSAEVTGKVQEKIVLL